MKLRSILMPEKGLLYGYLMPIFTVVLIVVLLGLSVINEWYRSRSDVGVLIIEHVTLLSDIFKRIDDSCTILGFDEQKNPINFLTIKKDGFVGSEVGSMNLGYPDKWEGPYVQDNLTVLGKEYLVVRTHRGYFITPGEGVKLPNGKVIGKDLLLDEDADIAKMAEDDKDLQFRGKPLAVPLEGKNFIMPSLVVQDWMDMV